MNWKNYILFKSVYVKISFNEFYILKNTLYYIRKSDLMEVSNNILEKCFLILR